MRKREVLVNFKRGNSNILKRVLEEQYEGFGEMMGPLLRRGAEEKNIYEYGFGRRF